MITLNLFTSGRHTQPLIKVLKEAENIQVLNIYQSLLEKPKLADVFLVADFGQIIPRKILETPKYGSLCIHPSLLPKYRGTSPVQYAILNGEKETGVTIFKMDEKVDHGPIIAQFKEEIRPDDTSESLYARLFAAGGQVLLTILPAWIEGRIEPREQNHKKATYTKILKREDGKIDWGKSDEEIECFIRAMSPWPGAWTEIKVKSQKSCLRRQAKVKSRRLKILKAHLEETLNTQHVTAKQIKLILDVVQLEGKKPVSWKQFKEGYPETDLSRLISRT